MKICVVAHTALQSDARVRREAESLAEQGHSIDIFCLKSAGEAWHEIINGMHVYRIMKYRKHSSVLAVSCQLCAFFLISLFWISFLFLRKRYDVIHIHNVPDFEVFAALIPKLYRARVILDMHETMPELYMQKFNFSEEHWTTRLVKAAERVSIRFADHVITASPIWRAHVIERSAPPEKCTTIINLPDPKYFRTRIRPDSQGNGKFRLVYPGSLNKHQGVEVVLKAARLIIDESSIPLEFHIYGSGPDQQRLQTLARQLGLTDVIIFHRAVPVEELNNILLSMDVGVVPKANGKFANEAMSTKLFEFAAVGLPAVVSRTTGDTLYFKDSMVLFYEPGNERQLADGIIRLYNDPLYRRDLAKNSELVFEEVSWPKVKKELYMIFDSLELRN